MSVLFFSSNCELLTEAVEVTAVAPAHTQAEVNNLDPSSILVARQGPVAIIFRGLVTSGV